MEPVIKQELDFEESTERDEDISMPGIETERDVDIENQINKILGTTSHEEIDHNDICETNIKKEKEVPSSNGEESLPKIKTEELIQERDGDSGNSETGAQWESQMKDQTVTQRHETNVHKKNRCKYRCKYCDYSSHQKRDLANHIMTTHEKDVIKKHGCSHCDYWTHIKNDLKTHILKKHNEHAIKRYGCDDCDFRAPLKRDLSKHILKQHGKDVFYCFQCDYSTNNRFDLQSHVLAEHSKRSNKKYGCDLCPFITHKSMNLTKHKFMKHGKNTVRTHDCQTCDYRTYQKKNLLKHIASKH